MYVCMSVCNGFTIEIYGFMHSLRTFGTCHSGCHRANGGMEIEVEDSKDRRQCQNESRCMEDS